MKKKKKISQDSCLANIADGSNWLISSSTGSSYLWGWKSHLSLSQRSFVKERLWSPGCPWPTLRPTHFLSTAISFSRLLSRKAGDFLMHFRANSFPVTLCFTRKTSEKAPLSRKHQEINISTGRLGNIAGDKSKGQMKEGVAGNLFHCHRGHHGGFYLTCHRIFDSGARGLIALA